MINGIEGQFGSGKSSTAVYLAKQQAIQTVKLISKGLIDSYNTIILSNIKIDSFAVPNYVYFEDDKFLEVLRTCNAVNDMERYLYYYFKEGNSLVKWKRNKFTKYYIFFDEVGAIMNGRNSKEFNNVISEYINQNRKNFEEIFIITADGEQSDKSLRRFVDWWYYVEPLASFPILRDFAVVHRMKKDAEGKPLLEYFIGKDQNGDYITKSRPVDEYLTFYYKPFVRGSYDDLHKNIKDKEKYIGCDLELLNQIIEKKPELLESFKKTNKFNEIKGEIKLLTL